MNFKNKNSRKTSRYLVRITHLYAPSILFITSPALFAWIGLSISKGILILMGRHSFHLSPSHRGVPGSTVLVLLYDLCIPQSHCFVFLKSYGDKSPQALSKMLTTTSRGLLKIILQEHDGEFKFFNLSHQLRETNLNETFFFLVSQKPTNTNMTDRTLKCHTSS